MSVAQPDGPEFQVNSYTSLGQDHPRVASDTAGDYVVVWQSNGQDGSGYGVYAQRYNSLGVAQGSEFRVNTYTTSDQLRAAVAMDAAGDFVVAWDSLGQDGGSRGIYAQRFSAVGSPQGGEFRANSYTTSDQSNPSVAMDSAGDFVIAWQSNGEDGSGYGVYAQRYSAGGAMQGSEFRANTYTTSNQLAPSAAMDSAGDFVVTWESYHQDGDKYGVYAQRYSAAGGVQGSEFRINTYTTSSEARPAAAMDSAGDFVVAWASNGEDGSNYGIYAQRYSSSGAVPSSEFRVNTYTTGYQQYPAAAMDSAGDFVITWASNGQDGSDYGVYAERYDSSGLAEGFELRGNTSTTGRQILPAAAMDARGDFLAAWASYGQDGSKYGIYAQRYVAPLPGAAPSGGIQFKVNSYTTGLQDAPRVASDSAGDFVVTWESKDGSQYGVYAQRYTAAGQAAGSEFRVNTTTSLNQEFPAVAMDTAGDFVIVWESYGQDGSGFSICAQRYNAAGQTVGSEFIVNTYTDYSQETPDVAMDAAGDFVVTWASDLEDGDAYGIYARRYSSYGFPLANEVPVNTFTPGEQIEPTIAMDPAGEYVIAWTSDGQTLGNFDIYAQRYSAGGVAQGSEFRVNTDTASGQGMSAAAMDPSGNFVVTWTSYLEDGSRAGVFGQRYRNDGTPQASEFQVNTYTTSDQSWSAVAMDADGDFVVTWQSHYEDGSGYGIYAQQYNSAGTARGSEFRINAINTNDQQYAAISMDPAGDFVVAWTDDYLFSQDDIEARIYDVSLAQELTISGQAGDSVIVKFTDAGDFTISITSGGATTSSSYPISAISKLVYDGPSGYSKLQFIDSFHSYEATQSFASTGAVGPTFELDADQVANLYVYSSGTATVNVAGSDVGNFFVTDLAHGYSYIADPNGGVYSELSGFGPETVTGSGGTTYAYVYSASHAALVGDPAGSSATVGADTTTLGSFPQLYVVGASDGTDSVMLHTEGGSFVGTPSFSYVGGNFNSASFLIGALYSANVLAQGTHATDGAFFYSYPNDTFNGAVNNSSLTGSATSFASYLTFAVQATGFQAVSVLESGSGTDLARLASPGGGSFVETAGVSTLAVGPSTITVDTFLVDNNNNIVPVAAQISVVGNHDGTDTATLYDSAGSNALTVGGSTATLKTSLLAVSVDKFGSVTADQQAGSSDTEHQTAAIDFALNLVGNWTTN